MNALRLWCPLVIPTWLLPQHFGRAIRTLQDGFLGESSPFIGLFRSKRKAAKQRGSHLQPTPLAHPWVGTWNQRVEMPPCHCHSRWGVETGLPGVGRSVPCLPSQSAELCSLRCLIPQPSGFFQATFLLMEDTLSHLIEVKQPALA